MRIFDDGKEGCVREIQEGFPAPFHSLVFQLAEKPQALFVGPFGPTKRADRRSTLYLSFHLTL